MKGGRIGNQIKLIELSGVLKANIYLSLKKCPIVAPVPSWKKVCCGNGRAKKPEIKKALKEMGYDFKTQDEYDALGVAMYARSQKKIFMIKEKR